VEYILWVAFLNLFKFLYSVAEFPEGD
jgi:hypothetical protein